METFVWEIIPQGEWRSGGRVQQGGRERPLGKDASSFVDGRRERYLGKERGELCRGSGERPYCLPLRRKERTVEEVYWERARA